MFACRASALTLRAGVSHGESVLIRLDVEQAGHAGKDQSVHRHGGRESRKFG
jgi:hypothetical protein